MIFHRIYYSVGGGFVQTEAELMAAREGSAQPSGQTLPHPFRSAREMLQMGEACCKLLPQALLKFLIFYTE